MSCDVSTSRARRLSNAANKRRLFSAQQVNRSNNLDIEKIGELIELLKNLAFTFALGIKQLYAQSYWPQTNSPSFGTWSMQYPWQDVPVPQNAADIVSDPKIVKEADMAKHHQTTSGVAIGNKEAEMGDE